MSPYVLIAEMKKLLKNLDTNLDKAATHATAKKFDTKVLLQSRLAPDMLPLMFQIQTACDTAKFAAARTTGKDAPSMPDTEQTLDEAKQRIAKTIAYLDGFKQADFEGIESRTVSLPRWEGKSMTALDYFIEHALPNFMFHVTTSYAILRHNGVELGKRDFLGQLTMK
jgi:uncharacterized protein